MSLVVGRPSPKIDWPTQEKTNAASFPSLVRCFALAAAAAEERWKAAGRHGTSPFYKQERYCYCYCYCYCQLSIIVLLQTSKLYFYCLLLLSILLWASIISSFFIFYCPPPTHSHVHVPAKPILPIKLTLMHAVKVKVKVWRSYRGGSVVCRCVVCRVHFFIVDCKKKRLLRVYIYIHLY